MPSVVRQDIDNTSAYLTVTINRDELKPKLDAELKKYRQKAPVKGFRPGQAPMDFIKRMYGTAIFSETVNEMFSHSLFEYIKENSIETLGQPLPVEDQKKYSFKINEPEPEYEVTYQIGFVKPIDLQGLDKKQQFERLTISNLEELAADDLQYARKRMGKRSNPETDIQDNDIVRVAAKELDGDAPKKDGWETTVTLHLKSLADEALRADLLKKKKGDTLRFNARNVEKHEDDAMFRKYILNLTDENADRVVGDLFEGVIEEVSRVEDAELNDEFYQGYFGGAVSNEEEAIQQLKKGIEQFYDARSGALLLRDFKERLMELNPIELPDAFLVRWLKLTNEGRLSEETVETEYPAFAENLRWSMIKDKIKDEFGIEVTEEDVKEEYVRRVRQYFQMDLPDHVLESSVERLMKDAKDLENTRNDLEMAKVFEAIRGQVTVTDKALPSEEFHKILEAATAENAPA
jgi:trigger factor